LKHKKLILLSLATSILYSCISQAVPKKQKRNKKLPTVVIVTTGGTIAEKTNPKTGGDVPTVTGKALINAVPGLEKLANIEVVELFNVDSSRITPKQWTQLSKKVDELLKKSYIKGAVVTHGTDTMAEGAYFLDLTIKSKKPIVVVGAMRDAGSLSPDGPKNLYNAVLQVTSPKAQKFGVTLTMNQYINSARHVRKTDTTNVQTFDSGRHGYLGYIAVDQVHKFHDRLPEFKFSVPEKLAKVDLVKEYAGFDGSFIRHAVDNGAKGIVVEGVGAGNVNKKVYEAIKYALSKNVVVIVATRVFNGAVYPIYGGDGGAKTLQTDGAILNSDLTGPKARILLMLALSNGKSKKEIESYFVF